MTLEGIMALADGYSCACVDAFMGDDTKREAKRVELREAIIAYGKEWREAGAKAEREACARVCDIAAKPREGELHTEKQWAAMILAGAIRARGEK